MEIRYRLHTDKGNGMDDVKKEQARLRQISFAEKQREMGRKKYSWWMTPQEAEIIGVQIDQMRLNTLYVKSDYSHIARDAEATLHITAAEMGAILCAYDRGLVALDDSERQALDDVISKLKDELWP